MSPRPQFRCLDERRLQRVRDETTLNGIAWLEVLDHAAPPGTPPQRTLVVRCLRALPPAGDLAAFDAARVRLTGGVRTDAGINPVRVLWAVRASDATTLPIPVAEAALYAALPDADALLIVRTSSAGDYSPYELALTDGTPAAGIPPGFDPLLHRIGFSFKVECPSPLDCAPVHECPPAVRDEPELDYLAKDYASFRRLILDRLSVLMPGWRERRAPDFTVTLAELLAYAGDRLSYLQDAVAGEAYLGTARRRVSLRRHARLLDYHVHEGRNARAWLCLTVSADAERTGAAEALPVPTGARFVVAEPPLPDNLPPGTDPDDAWFLTAGAVFEPVAPAHGLFAAHNQIVFHTCGDTRCCLPRGATRATLREPADGSRLRLRAGDFLLFEETASPTTGLSRDADKTKHHVVRLTRVTPEAAENVAADGVVTRTAAALQTDPLTNESFVEVEWDAEDALPFALCVSAVVRGTDGLEQLVETAAARANVVLVDHGLTLTAQVLDPSAAPLDRPYRPALKEGPLTWAGAFDPALPAAQQLAGEPAAAVPALTAHGDGRDWSPRPDLLDSGAFDDHLVVEVDLDGLARLRFGDGTHGRRPAAGSAFTVTQRVGNGTDGNLGAGALTRFFGVHGLVAAIYQPLAAGGGVAPEAVQQVRQFAPQAFRVQERAVTAADYAEVTERHPEVQRALAEFRWTGSWHTVFVSVDRRGGLVVDAGFRTEIAAWLERYRLAGHDVEVRGAQMVALELALAACAKPGFHRSDVLAGLRRAFSAQDNADGTRGFFHPDQFTFGQPVYLSALYDAALRVPGVASVAFTRFQRRGRNPAGELAAGVLKPAAFEVVRLDNDRSFPERGTLEITVGGGL